MQKQRVGTIAEATNENLGSNTNFKVEKVATQMRFTITTKDSLKPVTLAEISIYGTQKDLQTYYNIAKGKPATSTIATAEDASLEYVTDEEYGKCCGKRDGLVQKVTCILVH